MRLKYLDNKYPSQNVEAIRHCVERQLTVSLFFFPPNPVSVSRWVYRVWRPAGESVEWLRRVRETGLGFAPCVFDNFLYLRSGIVSISFALHRPEVGVVDRHDRLWWRRCSTAAVEFRPRDHDVRKIRRRGGRRFSFWIMRFQLELLLFRGCGLWSKVETLYYHSLVFADV